MNKLLEVVVNVACGLGFLAVAITLGTVIAIVTKLLPKKSYQGHNSYGFKSGDFVRWKKNFGSNKAIESGQLAWLDWGKYPSDRITMRPVSKELIERWPQGAFAIYDVEMLQYCEFATIDDNKEIEEYLHEYHSEEYACKCRYAWRNRLTEIHVSA